MQIPLKNGGFAIIDDEDEERCKGFRWRRWDDYRKPDRSHYAGYYTTENGKTTVVYLHSFIMNAPKGQKVDHINHNGLDNRKTNLRLCTQSQNRANGRQWKIPKSGFRGVYPSGRRWFAAISNGSHSVRHLGTFDTKEQAAQSYDKAASLKWGEFASLNFPIQPTCP